MKKDYTPKWQRELQCFLGVKSGIILEGNIYDEYPTLIGNGSVGIGYLDKTIRFIAAQSKGTVVIYCDPILGFYCNNPTVEGQQKLLDPLFVNYKYRDIIRTKNVRGKEMQTVYRSPTKAQNDSACDDEENKYIWISKIVRDTMTEQIPLFDQYSNIVFVMNFASRLGDCNPRLEESNLMYMNFMAATTSAQAHNGLCHSLILVVDKYNDIPAWFYMNNPNVRTITIGMPDRNIRRMYLEKLQNELQPFSLLGKENYEPGINFIKETEGFQCRELSQILNLAYKMHIMPDDIHTAFSL